MKEIFSRLLQKQALSEAQAFELFQQMMEGAARSLSDAQVGAYLFSTSERQIEGPELAGAARSLREHMIKVPLKESLSGKELLDTCGTGGSGLKTFNTSTAVAFVCAAAGQVVAKHGNRAITSASGSADVLEALGVVINLPPAGIIQLASETGFCFMLAPEHHPATKRAARIRRELGFRTIFNFLGPLVNPALAGYQLMGVSSRSMLPPIIEALRQLGVKRAMVVCGEDGLDEFTVNGVSEVRELKNGEVRAYHLLPEDVGIKRSSLNDLLIDSARDSAEKLRRVLQGFEGAGREIVSYNAGAALYVSGHAQTIKEGVVIAKDTLDSGAALSVLERAIEVSREWRKD
jgi:anthranilate phosphoribosyltransferase